MPQGVDRLKARDLEVKTHEAAHLAAAGSYAQGGASYTYQTGPDGKRYAVGGEVSIDASPVSGDPQATIAKMRIIRSAALAPSNPSSQDYKVAATASQEEAKARMELARETSDDLKTGGAEAKTAGPERAETAKADAGLSDVSDRTWNSGNIQSPLAVSPGVESNGISPLTTSIAPSDITKSLNGNGSKSSSKQNHAANHYLANSRLAMGDQTMTRHFGIFA